MTSAPRVPLKQLASLITKGTTPKTLGLGHASAGIPFLRAENIRDLTVVPTEDPLYIDERVDEALRRSRIKPNDVLISIAGTIGRVAVVPPTAPPMNCNQAVAIVRLEQQLTPRYLAHWLSSSDAQAQIGRAQVTATISNLSLGQIGDLAVPVPPLPEQRRISDILDKADAIRRRRKEAIALTEELLRSAFLEMVGPEAKGYSSWPEATFESLAAPGPGTMRTGPFGSDLRHSEFVDEGVAVLGIDNAVQNRFAWDERRYITREKYDRLRRYTVRPHDVIITIMGTTGRSAVVPEDIPVAITTKHLATITVDRELAEPEFVAQAIHRHPAVLSQIRKANRGAIMSGLNLGLIKSLVVRRPPVERQRQFAAFTKQVRLATTQLEAARDESTALFDSLVHRAFRGELRHEHAVPKVQPSEPQNERAVQAFRRLDFEPTARQLYDQLLILRPDVLVEGLFRRESNYYFVSPDTTSSGADGRSFQDWFENSFVPLGMPFHLVRERPEDSIELQPRSPREAADGHGVVRTWPDLQRDLALWLPRGVPYIDVREDDRTAVVRVGRALSDDETIDVERTFEQLGSALPFRVEVVPTGSNAKDWKVDRIELKPARLLSDAFPKAVRDAVADDDDFWRQRAPAGLLNPGEKLVPPRTDAFESSCLVSTTFPPANIRSYLSLYSTVVLVAPLADQLDSTLKALGVQRKELVELARRRCVRFLFPQAIGRYDVSWIADLLEGAPDSVMFSRRLAATTLADQHRRNPLFALPATAYEKRSLLRALHRAADDAPPMPAVFLRALTRALSEYWASAEYALHARGAMASLTGGLASFGAAVATEIFKKDLFIEMSVAAQNVEWAGALGAHLVPEQGAGYSSEGASALLVALSSGGMKSAQATAAPKEFALAEDLLAFDNDTNVLEFVSELGKGDLARFRTLIREIASAERTPEEIAALLETWNAQVRQYERRPDRLKSFNIVGLLLAAGSTLSANVAVHSIVPLIALLLPFVLTKANEDTVREVPSVGAVFDWANATLAGTAPPAVLLSRMRKRVVGMREPNRGAG